MSRFESSPRYGVVVPVKPPAVAKSRLSPLGDPARAELAAAFAMDTVSAALDCPVVARVLAVTDDFRLADALREVGAEVMPDGVSDDLNGTLAQAAAELVRRDPQLVVAALCADLPALRPEELGRALAAAPTDAMAFVADAEGSGTTLVTAPDLAAFDPRFGPGSAQAHRSAGAREIEVADVPSLRRDVDTPADLEVALGLGVGPRTSLVSTALRRPAGH
ncbi:MAG: 2-phospho-L-lactate guanylyltransferase [Nocardioidaceae bacterium]